VLITSQNHGFAVDPATLPANVHVTHVSLFDGSLQGFARTDRPAFCFQGHPEASPGPHDADDRAGTARRGSDYMFEGFVRMIEEHQHGGQKKLDNADRPAGEAAPNAAVRTAAG